jgi:hypothetical protein
MEEKLPYYVESICKALSINNEQELNQLMTLFDKNNIAQKEDMNFILDQSVEDSRGSFEKFDSERGSKLEIDPDNVLRLLKEFYEEKKKKTREQSNFTYNILK